MPRPFQDSSGEDLVRTYLTEIGRRPLLRADQEIALAKTIEAGTKADAQLAGAPESLSVATRMGLRRRSAEGAVARRAFIEANLRLVVSIARKYQGFGLPLLDLIQDGNIGLLRAVEKFDWRLGFKFSTYATWWVRQGISRGLAERSRTIRLPVHIAEQLNRLRRTDADLAATLGREPTEAEVAAALDITIDQLRSFRDQGLETMSLQTPIGEEGDWELQDVLEDELCDQPLDEAVRSRSNAELREVIKALKPREQRVLELRFGLADGKQRTLEQVGVEFKLTRERIRQIEAKAIAKLRHPMNGRMLQDFMD